MTMALTLWRLLEVLAVVAERRRAQVTSFEARAAALPLGHPHAAELRTAAERVRAQIVCLDGARGTLGRHSAEIAEALAAVDPSEEETAS